MPAVTDQNDKEPDGLSVISYLVAAAILIPIGWWLKGFLHDIGFGNWVVGLFH